MYSSALKQKKSAAHIPVDTGYLGYFDVMQAFDRVLHGLKDVLYYQSVGNHRGRVTALQEAQDTLRAIAASIEPDTAVPASENLARLLQFIVFSLETTLRSNKVAPVQEAMAMLEPIRDTFAGLQMETA
jgi:flagellin-specific chaperone FliS